MEKLMKIYASVPSVFSDILDCIGLLVMTGMVFFTLGAWLALLLAPAIFAGAVAWRISQWLLGAGG